MKTHRTSIAKIAAFLLFVAGVASGATSITINTDGTWGGDGGEGGTGMRAVLDPTAYALAGKAGFTGAWWTEKPDAVLLEEGGAAEAAEKKEEGGTWSAGTGEVERRRPFTGGRRVVAAAGRSLAATEKTAPGPSKPEMRYPEGWEPRMFSGVELDYPEWTSRSWRAKAEVEFDAAGRPEHVFLTEPSGLAKVDARLARGIHRWRLLDGAAARRGEVEWVVPMGAGKSTSMLSDGGFPTGTEM